MTLDNIFEELDSLYEAEADDSKFTEKDIAEVSDFIKHVIGESLTEGTRAGEDPYPSLGLPFLLSWLYHDYIDPRETRYQDRLNDKSLNLDRTIKPLISLYNKVKHNVKPYLIRIAIEYNRDNYKFKPNKLGISPEEMEIMLTELLEVL